MPSGFTEPITRDGTASGLVYNPVPVPAQPIIFGGVAAPEPDPWGSIENPAGPGAPGDIFGTGGYDRYGGTTYSPSFGGVGSSASAWPPGYVSDGSLGNLNGVTIGGPAATPTGLGDLFEQGAQMNAAAQARASAAAAAAAARARAYELAQRDQSRLFAIQELEQQVKDIKGRYRPDLQAATSEIRDTRARAAADAAIFTTTMADVLPAFEAAGMLTQEHYDAAVTALNTESADARAQSDARFASAEGRIRAMVLAVSGDNPDAIGGLTEDLDALRAFADDEATDNEEGNLRLADAVRATALAAAVQGGAQAVGELGREQKQTAIAYEKALTEMLRSRRQIKRTQAAALQSARDWAALQQQQQDAAWDLQDQYRGGGGGYGGGFTSGGLGRNPVTEFGEDVPFTSQGYTTVAINAYLSGSGVPERDRYDVAAAIRMAADLGLSYDEWLQTDGAQNDLAFAQRYDDQIRAGLSTVDTAYSEWERMTQFGSLGSSGGQYGNQVAAYNYALDRGYSEGDARDWAEQAATDQLFLWQNNVVQSPADAADAYMAAHGLTPSGASFRPQGGPPVAPQAPATNLWSLLQQVPG